MFQSFMHEALLEAKKAYALDEVPIGAVLVFDNKIISRAHNECHLRQSPLLHAEFIALEKGLNILKSYYLSQCDLYVTLEPCMFCLGAITHLRLRKLIFGAYSNHQSPDPSTIEVIGGIGERHSINLLQKFFQEKRS